MGKQEYLKNILLIVDPQIDFINGTLPVPGAKKAMDSLACYVDEQGCNYDVICVTCDRHNMRHCSFAFLGGEWPPHCIESSVGAAIWPPLLASLFKFSDKTHILYKGEDPLKDEYSIFQNPKGTEIIDNIIKIKDIKRIDICGLAGDVCVAATLSDAEKRYESINFNLLDEFTAYLSK